jgi:uncharacterized protein (UPF0333 family)
MFILLFFVFVYSDAGKPITKKAFKKLQKDNEKAERKAATAAKMAAEKAEREASNVVSFFLEFTGKTGIDIYIRIILLTVMESSP